MPLIPILLASQIEFETVDNDLLSLISYHQPWNVPIPVSSNIGNDSNKQHLIWEYSGITWGTEVVAGPSITIFHHHYQLQRSA